MIEEVAVIKIGIQPIGLGRLDQAVHGGAGFGSLGMNNLPHYLY